MPAYHEKRVLPYTPRQMFELVADVAKYHEFLPWCAGSRVNWRKENVLNADVDIGYKILRETFNSNVVLDPHEKIDVVYQSGPFAHLRNYWTFRPVKVKRATHCEVEFDIDFRFSSGLLNAAMSLVFEEAVKKMIGAFETRAAEIYRKAD
ncbi:MAG TPA: type II toxin-antitoxin system RatA family toxin [Alphaproteobacteria bacterium]|nr:type II toxin-antitoxin system RatA family toxin [Alphaproteobacteria bacterium]